MIQTAAKATPRSITAKLSGESKRQATTKRNISVQDPRKQLVLHHAIAGSVKTSPIKPTTNAITPAGGPKTINPRMISIL